MERNEKVGVDLGLTKEEKKILLSIARTTIVSKARGQSLPEVTPATPTLNENRGAFVSLHRHGNLRGCIGYIQAVKPLYQTIQEMALSAAFRDPRFPPLEEKDLADLDIEISVLTPMREVSDITEIEIGRDGLMIIKEPHSGLLLPQVATEYGWDRETFLSQTCIKAGLPVDAWKDTNTTVLAFSADVF
ncbi:AmmeMemoRadiSam system protein A [Thermodesulfobacteriota bacterium]